MKTRRQRIKRNKSIKRGGYTPFIDPNKNNGQFDYGYTKPDDTSSNTPYILGGIGVLAAGVGLTIYFL
jgi:hypothetical protein